MADFDGQLMSYAQALQRYQEEAEYLSDNVLMETIQVFEQEIDFFGFCGYKLGVWKPPKIIAYKQVLKDRGQLL